MQNITVTHLKPIPSHEPPVKEPSKGEVIKDPPKDKPIPDDHIERRV